MELLSLAAFIGLLLALLNVFLYRKARRLVLRWRADGAARRWIGALRAGFLLMNTPFLVLVVLWASGVRLHQVPERVLHIFFYPFYAWVVMLVAFLFIAFPTDLVAGIFFGARWLFRRLIRPAALVQPVADSVVARRNFLATVAAVVPPVLFAISTHAVYGSDDLEVSPIVEVPVKDLPPGFDGFTITQLSDLHAGAYIRERELARVVDLANGVGSDLVVITGDMLDSSMDMLPALQRELRRLNAPRGVYGILGNHDYYADRRRSNYPGCLRIIAGMEEAGVRMLRNQHTALRADGDELLLMGLDWTGMARGNPNLYMGPPTRDALARTIEGYRGNAPRILLAHHPHVFYEAAEFNIALTLAGHTHGGGQVVIAEHNGRPVALGSTIFRYLSGLYCEGGHYLYVNRGVGVVGLPIRIKCPPEISRFRLIRA